MKQINIHYLYKDGEDYRTACGKVNPKKLVGVMNDDWRYVTCKNCLRHWNRLEKFKKRGEVSGTWSR